VYKHSRDIEGGVMQLQLCRHRRHSVKVSPVGDGSDGRLNSMPKDYAFGGLWVFARDERVTASLTETDGTEADESRVETDLKVPSMRCAEEEGEESDGKVRGHRDDGSGSKIEGGES